MQGPDELLAIQITRLLIRVREPISTLRVKSEHPDFSMRQICRALVYAEEMGWIALHQGERWTSRVRESELPKIQVNKHVEPWEHEFRVAHNFA